MPTLKSDFLKSSNKNRDTLLVLIGVACSILVLDYAGKTSGVLSVSPFNSFFKSQQSFNVLEQSPDLATALSRLKRSHGKYCDQAVSVCIGHYSSAFFFFNISICQCREKKKRIKMAIARKMKMLRDQIDNDFSSMICGFLRMRSSRFAKLAAR
jgi:hypothetical protein